MNSIDKKLKRVRRHKKIRSVVSGTSERPRLSVFKSNKYIYAQLVDDVAGVTLAFSTSLGKNKGKNAKQIASAEAVGNDLAVKALEKKIKKVVFDRGGYVFTGRVKAIAGGARKGGLEF